eukprot:scaffold248461_cov107-Cyclotella_meneghiniana.AAC.1
MSFTLFDTILQSYQQTLSWKQSFLLPPGENSDLELDLCCAVGTDAVTPLKATDQPAPNRYIADSCYRFPNKYRGKAAMDDVIDLLKKSLPGSNFILQTGVKSSGSFIRRTLVCGHNLTVQDRLKSKKFEGDSYIQSGVREENIKSKKSAGELSSFDLMSTKSKLKSKQATKSRKTSGYSLNQPSNRHENEATIDNKTIHNMIQKETNIKSSKLGITSCMTTAEKAIAYLNHENISSVVIYDDVETGVMLHNNPSGRPSKANIRDVTLAEKVEDLRIAHGSDSKMVLLLSFSTDKMIRGMQMYPEVWFLDVTGRANKQKR